MRGTRRRGSPAEAFSAGGRREDVRAVCRVAVVHGYEDGQQEVADVREALVLAQEIAERPACRRCLLDVERGRREPALVAGPACRAGAVRMAMDDPVVRRHTRGRVFRPEVIVGNGPSPVRRRVDPRDERLLVRGGRAARRLVDLDRHRPRLPVAGRSREANLADAAEARVLPDDVQRAARPVDRNFGKPAFGPNVPPGFGVEANLLAAPGALYSSLLLL